MLKPLQILPATVRLQNGVPWSATFGDRYWSEHGDPCAEAETSFIQANRLAERWQQMPPGSAFTIGEIGFGTGLNFLCTWRLWQRLRRPGCRLHYLALDLQPPAMRDLPQLHAHLPQIRTLSAQLCGCGLPTTGGVHTRQIEPKSVWLTLAIGDAEACLRRMMAACGSPPAAPMQIDAWFMDGFAPTQNPTAWSAGLCRQMALFSHKQTTLASYSAAGVVRRALTEAGFRVTRKPGYGGKRHRIEADFAGGGGLRRQHKPPSVMVLGGGLAGAASARALAMRGCAVSLLDGLPDSLLNGTATSPASANPAAILRPRISTGGSEAALHWNLSGYLLALHQLRSLPAIRWQQTGVLQYLPGGKARRRAARLVGARQISDLWQHLNDEEAMQYAGVALRPTESPDAGLGWLYYPQAGQVNLPNLCSSLLEDTDVERPAPCAVARLQAGDDGWRALDSGGNLLACADICVLATAGKSAVAGKQIGVRHSARYLGLQPIRGQMDCIAARAESAGLLLPLCGAGGLFPADADGLRHWTGASRIAESDDLQDPSGAISLQTEPCEHQSRQNIAKALGLLALPVGDAAVPPSRHSWVAHRWQSRDGLPLAGAPTDRPADAAPLYLNLGLGGRGLAFAFLAAELIAAQIFAEPPPLDGTAVQAAAP